MKRKFEHLAPFSSKECVWQIFWIKQKTFTFW